MRLFQVVGRKAPTKSEENPEAYRMKIFAPNEVIAKSRFWYFMHQMRKMKKTTGEILDVNEVRKDLFLTILLCYYHFLVVCYFSSIFLFPISFFPFVPSSLSIFSSLTDY
jgi:hypothetical protein